MKVTLQIYLLFSILFFSVQTYAAKTKAVFEVTTNQNVYAIGHAIDIIFETRNISQSLSSLELNVLNKDFVVHDYNVDKFEDLIDGTLVRVENLVVRLYPRRTGKLSIPRFKLGRYRSKSIPLSIINDFNSAIKIRTTTVKKTYFQREPINVYVDIYYRRKKNISSIGELKNENFIISDVVKTEYTTKDNDNTIPVDRFSWIVTPLVDGLQTLHLPMIKTGGRRMFPSGKLKLNVVSLPSTLPGMVPVSKQTITNNKVTDEKMWINKVYYWTFTLIGNGLNENTLDKILNSQLRSNSIIRYFPKTFKKIRINNGAQFKIDVKIPFKLYKTGEFVLPVLDIPYISSETGIIEHSFSNEISLMATSDLIENSKSFLALFLFLIIFTLPISKIIRRAYIRNRYRMCYYAVAMTGNPKKIKDVLFKYTPHLSTEQAVTIKQWEESASVLNPEQRDVIKKIGILLDKFNYAEHHSKTEVAVLKKLLKSLI